MDNNTNNTSFEVQNLKLKNQALLENITSLSEQNADYRVEITLVRAENNELRNAVANLEAQVNDRAAAAEDEAHSVDFPTIDVPED